MSRKSTKLSISQLRKYGYFWWNTTNDIVMKPISRNFTFFTLELGGYTCYTLAFFLQHWHLRKKGIMILNVLQDLEWRSQRPKTSQKWLTWTRKRSWNGSKWARETKGTCSSSLWSSSACSFSCQTTSIGQYHFYPTYFRLNIWAHSSHIGIIFCPRGKYRNLSSTSGSGR